MATEVLSKAGNKTHTLKFAWQNDTKGAIRYGEILPNGNVANAPNDPGAVIGTLYLRKTAVGNITSPTEIEVTVTY